MSLTSDPIDEWIVECLHLAPRDRQRRLDELCGHHPEQANALRARYAFLLDAGLIEGPQALAETLPERIGGFSSEAVEIVAPIVLVDREADACVLECDDCRCHRSDCRSPTVGLRLQTCDVRARL